LHCKQTFYNLPTQVMQLLLNPLKRSGVRWLHFEVSSAVQSNLHF